MPIEEPGSAGEVGTPAEGFMLAEPAPTKEVIAAKAIDSLQAIIASIVAAGIVREHEVPHMFERVWQPLREAAGR